MELTDDVVRWHFPFHLALELCTMGLAWNVVRAQRAVAQVAVQGPASLRTMLLQQILQLLGHWFHSSPPLAGLVLPILCSSSPVWNFTRRCTLHCLRRRELLGGTCWYFIIPPTHSVALVRRGDATITLLCKVSRQHVELDRSSAIWYAQDPFFCPLLGHICAWACPLQLLSQLVCMVTAGEVITDPSGHRLLTNGALQSPSCAGTPLFQHGFEASSLFLHELSIEAFFVAPILEGFFKAHTVSHCRGSSRIVATPSCLTCHRSTPFGCCPMPPRRMTRTPHHAVTA
mmetsp:Transcript_20716/g.47575  ORF Transcript_20716/g.47575 Transcript_20716/m.47575 type:complete len:287 (-) Transcript_20716:3-863(-)